MFCFIKLNGKDKNLIYCNSVILPLICKIITSQATLETLVHMLLDFRKYIEVTSTEYILQKMISMSSSQMH